MGYKYEIVRSEEDLPINAIIHSVDGFDMHWHKEIEIILVLEGTVKVRIGEEIYHLKENDLILVNCNELHSTERTEDNNVLLAIQIDPGFYFNCYPSFSKMEFDCRSFAYGENEQERFDVIRQYIAKILWELNKRDLGYKFNIGSYLYLLGTHLINNFDYTVIDEEESKLKDDDISRLQRIVNYVDENISEKITLKEIAKREHLNYYYLSHFIKDKMGMSFQDYLNSRRLDNAVNMLIDTNQTITEISYASGFSNVNFFNKLFKETYNCLPTEYKKQYADEEPCDKCYINIKKEYKSKSYLDVNRASAFKKLFSYLEPPEMKTQEVPNFTNYKEHIYINGKDRGKHFKPYWQKLATFGRASEGLRSQWRNQFRELQREIKFEYIRFHGIFMDEMMVYNLSKEGKIEYNWSYVDELFDFFMEMNIKPFVELGFMPSELKRSDETVYWWKGNISPPKDIKLWIDLVQGFVKHCINRYGLEEVETWYFEVWNEPEYEYFFWAGTKEEYFDFYKDTVLAIKSISEKLRVGGPSITHGTILGSNWLEDFLLFCNENNLPLDFLSVHIYPEYISEESMEQASLYYEKEADVSDLGYLVKKIYYDKDHTINTINRIKHIMDKSLNYKPEVHITEWNASSLFGNLIHDTSYVATFIIKNVLQSINTVDSLGYWTFTDIFEEHKLGISSFHGGFGLINKDGLKKPSYYAYFLLSKLGNKIMDQGDEYIITKKNEDIQVLVYNYTYFDDLFLSGDTSALSNTNRYSIYETKEQKEVRINIEGLSGNYKVTKYRLNRENGSVFDEWIKIGAPENMTKEELEYLKGKARPEMIVEFLELEGEYKEILYIPVHGIELVMLEKRI